MKKKYLSDLLTLVFFQHVTRNRHIFHYGLIILNYGIAYLALARFRLTAKVVSLNVCVDVCSIGKDRKRGVPCRCLDGHVRNATSIGRQYISVTFLTEISSILA